MISRLDVWQSLDEALPFVTVDDTTGEIAYVTAPLERMFGYPRRNDLLGKAVEVLLPASKQVNHPNHRQAYYEHPEVRPMGVGMILEGQHADGHTFPVSVTLIPAVIGMDRRPCTTAVVIGLTLAKVVP